MFSYKLNESENLVKLIRRHPVTFTGSVFQSFLIFLLIGAGGYFVLNIYQKNIKETALIIGFLIGLFYLLYNWLNWIRIVYIITDEHIIDIHVKGLFRKTVTEIEFSDVHEVLYEITGIIATLFKFGNVLVKTMEGTLVMNSVHKPEEVYKVITAIKKESQKER